MAWRYLPGSDEVAPMRVDWAGAALLSVGMLAVLLAVSEGEVWGWASPLHPRRSAWPGWRCWWCGRCWTLRSATPLVDLRMAVRPGIAAPNLVAFVAGLGMYCLLTLAVVLVRADEPGFGLGPPGAGRGADPGAVLADERARQPAGPGGAQSGWARRCCCRRAA